MMYLKEGLFLFIYAIMMSILSLACQLIGAVWARYALSIVSLLFYLFIVFFDMYQNGQKGAKKLHSNDLQRLHIVKTGDDVQIKTIEEYKAYKGFLMGASSCAFMVLFLLIHAIIMICGGELKTFGGLSTLIYMVYMAPFYLGTSGEISMGYHFIGLYGLVVCAVVSGIAYILGARKIQLQYDKIEAQQKIFYGE